MHQKPVVTQKKQISNSYSYITRLKTFINSCYWDIRKLERQFMFYEVKFIQHVFVTIEPPIDIYFKYRGKKSNQLHFQTHSFLVNETYNDNWEYQNTNLDAQFLIESIDSSPDTDWKSCMNVHSLIRYINPSLYVLTYCSCDSTHVVRFIPQHVYLWQILRQKDKIFTVTNEHSHSQCRLLSRVIRNGADRWNH